MFSEGLQGILEGADERIDGAWGEGPSCPRACRHNKTGSRMPSQPCTLASEQLPSSSQCMLLAQVLQGQVLLHASCRMRFQSCCMRTVPGVEGDDRVSEASSGVRHGSCAIRHCVQLVEATGLKAGGHEQEVCGSCDLVAHGDVEAHPAPRPVRVCVFHPPHSRLHIRSMLVQGTITSHGAL